MSLLGWIETCNVKISRELHVKIVLSLKLEIQRLTMVLFAKPPVFQTSSFPQSRPIYPWQNVPRHECFSLLLQRWKRIESRRYVGEIFSAKRRRQKKREMEYARLARVLKHFRDSGGKGEGERIEKKKDRPE